MMRTEVLIVGGGPAGTTCAWALQKRGLDVLLLEKTPFPRVKPCAGWVAPEVWKDLGVQPHTYPYPLTILDQLEVSIRGVRFCLRTKVYAVRRIEFDAWLAERSGVKIVHHQVRQIVSTGEGYVVDDTYSCRYLVGAGGTFCPVARTLFLSSKPRDPRARIITLETEYLSPIRASEMETSPQVLKDDRRAESSGTSKSCSSCRLWFFEEGLPGYAWFVPKAGGWINIGIGGAAESIKRKGNTLQKYWEKFLCRLHTFGLIKDQVLRPQGYVYYLRTGDPTLQQGNAFVVGDAAGLATLDMGEGIAPAIRSGLLVAEAICTRKPVDTRSIRKWSQPWPIKWFLKPVR